MGSQPSDPSQAWLKSKLTEAKRYHEQGELKEAWALYEEILAIHPGNVEVLHLSGIICIEDGDYAKAVERVSRAIVGWPDQPVLMNSLGLALMGLGRLDAAFARLKDAVRLKPDYAEAYCHLGRILLRQEKEREAVAEIQKAVRLEPKNPAANDLLSIALRASDRELLASYYQRLAWHYAQTTPDAADLAPKHTFFIDRDKARLTALQGHRVQETMAVTGSQMCYHLGDPFPDAPANLIQVPSGQKAFVAFFLSSRFSFPVDIDFDPAEIKDAPLVSSVITNLSHAWLAQIRESERLSKACQQTKPEFVPGQPLRVWLVASRKTTVMQYNARDLAQGFRNQGCEVSFLIEPNDMESFVFYHYLEDRLPFNPHIVVHINHLNNEELHPDVFNVTWWEDLMGTISIEKPLPWRKRDLIYSISQELDSCLYKCGAQKVHRQSFCYDDGLFRDFGWQRKRKVVVVASSYRNFKAKHHQAKETIAIFETMFEAGKPITDAELELYAKDSTLSKKDILFFLWGYVVRDLSVRWLCQLSDEIEVEVYGRHWEEDEVVRPFFKGVLPHGPAVAEVYNGAKYALVPHLFDLQSQRLMEATASGCLPIVYDCRDRAEKPHWDDNCLWYRTKEDLRACLTQEPTAPLQDISKGRSYSEFAERILMEVNAHLSGE